MIQALLTIDDIPSDNTCAIVDYLNGAGIRPSCSPRERRRKRTRNPNPENGAALYTPEGRHIILLHAHNETDELVPGYYRLLLDDLLNHGVQFVKPEFV